MFQTKEELDADYEMRCDKLDEELKVPEPPTPGPVLPADEGLGAAAQAHSSSSDQQPQPAESLLGAADSTKQSSSLTSESEKEKPSVLSPVDKDRSSGDQTNTEPTPNGNVSTTDMQPENNASDNKELEGEDAQKSNGDVPSHQPAESGEGQEVTKL